MLDLILVSFGAEDEEIFTHSICILAKLTNSPNDFYQNEVCKKLEDEHIKTIFKNFQKVQGHVTKSAFLLFICNLLSGEDIWVEVSL